MALVLSLVQTVLAFVVLVGAIVFFHELGHLLVGKALGVKARKFSLGFGPRLLGVRLGDTDYCLSAIPLGGYVKFAGDNPYEELGEDERGQGFLEQPPWKRAAIGLAGPGANFLLALVVFCGMAKWPHPEPIAQVGYVKPASPAAQAGLRAGDRILSVDGASVRTFEDLSVRLRAHPAGAPLQLRLVRAGQTRELTVVPELHEEASPLGSEQRARIGIRAQGRAPVISVIGPQTPAGQAGLHSFDRIVAVDGEPVTGYEQLAERLGSKTGAVRLQVLRPRLDAPPPDPKAAPLPEGQTLPADPLTLTLAGPLDPAAELPGVLPALRDGASRFGLQAADVDLFSVEPGSAAAQGGLQRGDRLVLLAGRPVWTWEELTDAIRLGHPLQLQVRRDGSLLERTIQLQSKIRRDELGSKKPAFELGVRPLVDVFYGPLVPTIEVRHGWLAATRRGLSATAEATTLFAKGFAFLLTGRVSSDAVGGPIMMAVVARDSAKEGFLRFFETLAAFSLNLGILNLIPLPILDGFHVFSAGVEAVRRRPLSLRFREMANVVGLVLLVGLMLLAFKNDLVRLVSG